MTFLLSDLQVWPWPTWTNVSNEQMCHIILKPMHKCTSYSLDKLHLRPFSNLTFKCDLDLQPSWTNVSNEPMCQIILNPCINVHVIVWTSSIYDHFLIWPSSVTLTFNQTEKMFWMVLLLLKDNNQAKLFWNSHKNAQVMARASTICDHFIIWPSKVTLTFSLPEQMFQIALLFLMDNICAKLFWNSCINVQVMTRTSSIYDLLSFDLQVWSWPSAYLNKCFKW